MRKAFLKYIVICVLLITSVGVKVSPVYADCPCSCAATCGGRCDSECSCESEILQFLEGLACCLSAIAQAERDGWMAPCDQGGQQ